MAFRVELGWPAGALIDPDLEPLTHTIKMANGSVAPAWLSINPATGALSGTPDPLDVGATFGLRITATDAAGTSASSDFSMTVLATAPNPVDTAPIGNFTINGTQGNDNLRNTAGNDLVNGGAGVDTVIYSANSAGYSHPITHIFPPSAARLRRYRL